jgi:hypothetical protein
MHTEKQQQEQQEDIKSIPFNHSFIKEKRPEVAREVA